MARVNRGNESTGRRCKGDVSVMEPLVDLERIDWNSVTDAKSLFETILGVLKSKDAETETMRKKIIRLEKETARLQEENEVLSEGRGMMDGMEKRIGQLEEENMRKDAEIERKDAEIERLRQENAALAGGKDPSQIATDRIAQLEEDLKAARATNSALAAENLGIKTRKTKSAKEYAGIERPGNDSDTTAKPRRRRDEAPADEEKTLDQTMCPIHGDTLSDPTEMYDRTAEDIGGGMMIVTLYNVIRRYCRRCRKQVSPDIPDIIPNESSASTS